MTTIQIQKKDILPSNKNYKTDLKNKLISEDVDNQKNRKSLEKNNEKVIV